MGETHTTPQARKKWPLLPDTLEVRLLTKTVKGKPVAMLTSLTDPMRYPGEDIVDLYAHRWEIELGYREMKQHLLESRFTLRSQVPELVTQELWGVLLTYNLIRYKMLLMAKSLPSVPPQSTEFSGCGESYHLQADTTAITNAEECPERCIGYRTQYTAI